MTHPVLQFRALPRQAQAAIVTFAAAGAIVAGWSLMFQPLSSPVRFLLLLVLAVGTARRKFRIYKDSSISFLTFVILLSILVTAGTTEAILIGVCGVSAQTYCPRGRVVLYRQLFNAGMIALTVKGSCLAYSFCMTYGRSEDQLVAVVAASAVYYLGNSFFVSLMVAFSTKVRVFQLWLGHFASSGPSYLIAGLLSLLVSELTMGLPQTVMLLMVIPVVIACYYLSLRLLESRT